MELRVFFVTMVCISCVMPPAFCTGLVALHADKGAAIFGTGAAIKGALVAKGLAAGAAVGAAVKGAAGLAAKGVAAKGAAVMAAKGAAAKGVVALAAKGAAMAHHAFHKPVVYKEVVWHPYYVKSMAVVPPARELVDRLAGVWDAVEGAIHIKSAAVGNMVHALQRHVSHTPAAYVYKAYPVPY